MVYKKTYATIFEAQKLQVQQIENLNKTSELFFIFFKNLSFRKKLLQQKGNKESSLQKFPTFFQIAKKKALVESLLKIQLL